MAWKTEKWLEEVFPGKDRIYEEYRLLPRRELAIVASSVLDCALADILSRRLLDKPKECEDFLGVNEDGRAPCASFGARIQLALLLGLITDADAATLRTLKNIRNKIAHRVKADLNSPEVLPLITNLHDRILKQSNELIEKGLLEGPSHDLELIRQFLPTVPEMGAAVIIVVLSVYQAYFHRIIERVVRIEAPELSPRV